MGESLRTRLTRWGFNLWPCYRGTGGRVTFIAADWREVRVRLPLNWRTRNYVGTIFGGSLSGSVDPFFMIMLIQLLGPDCTVWDKAATVRFRKPGRSTLQAVFRIPEEETTAIRRLPETDGKLDRVYRVNLEDAQGTVHAEIEKIIQIRKNTIKQHSQDG